MIDKKKSRPVYSPEFKADAVAKCLEIGAYKVSKELGVSPVTLRSWVLKSGKDPKSKGKASYEDLENENRKLKKELGYVQEINKVLKKSTAIFSGYEMENLR